MAAPVSGPQRNTSANTTDVVAPSRQKGKSKKARAKTSATGNVDGVANGTTIASDIAKSASGEGSSWSWSTIADSGTSQQAPTFTKDGNYFFSTVGAAVKIYSSSTGKIVSTLSALSDGHTSRDASRHGHSKSITAAVLNPENPFQLITASLDGLVKIWDFMDAKLLQTLVIGEPITQMCTHERCKGYVFVSIPTKERSATAKQVGNTMIHRVALSSAKTSLRHSKPSQILKVGKTKNARSLSVSSSGDWLVVLGGSSVYVAATASLSSGFSKYDSPEKLTALAVHPTEDCFATGDNIGQIRLWYCLDGRPVASHNPRNSNKAQTTIMHWHAHAVSALSFTPNGAYLLSGGEESVLVIWQLHSGKREFVPRIGAPIVCIAVRSTQSGGEEFLVGLVDGTYVFVHAATLTATRMIARVKLDPSRLSRRSAQPTVPLAVHQLTSSVVIPSSHPSSLQIYSPSTSALLLELEVSPSNRVSRRDDEPIEPARIEKVVISRCGEWMATIDTQSSERHFTTEVYLKIWKWCSGTWVLNTRIDRPHGTHSLTAILFNPRASSRSQMLLTTTGLDGTVRTWGILTSTRKDEQIDEFWSKRSSFSFRKDIPKHAAVSADGSLLAVIFGESINLHESYSGKLLESICSSQIRTADLVCFVGRSGRYLLIKGNRDCVLWDVIGRSVKWRYRCPHVLSHVLSHPSEEWVAVLSNAFVSENQQQTTRLLVFSTSSPQPLDDHDFPFRLHSLAWFPDNSTKGFIGITTQWEVVLFGEGVKSQTDREAAAQSISNDVHLPSERRTLFQDIYGKSALVDMVRETIHPPTDISDVHDKALGVFSAPSHLSPAISSLYSSLMSHVLVATTLKTDEALSTEVETDNHYRMHIDGCDESRVSVESSRRVNFKEIDSLVELFGGSLFTTSVANNHSKLNGAVCANHQTKLNGLRIAKQINATGLATPSQTASSAPSSPGSRSPVPTDKKRKKILEE